MNNLARSFLSTAAAALLAACASGPPSTPPNSALTDAQTAISKAEQAGAGQYASVALRNARQKLAAAQQALGPHRDNDDQFVHARRLAEEAAVDAQLATEQARAKQTEAQMNQLRQGNASGRSAPSSRGVPSRLPGGGS